MLRSPGLLGQAEGTLETRFSGHTMGRWWGARQGEPMWQTHGDRGLMVSQCQGPKGGRTCTTWATLGGGSEVHLLGRHQPHVDLALGKSGPGLWPRPWPQPLPLRLRPDLQFPVPGAAGPQRPPFRFGAFPPPPCRGA